LLLLLQLKTMKIVALEKAKPANCGAKAAACAELAKVAAGARFSTPAGICLPFGTMDAAIKVHAPSSTAMHKTLATLHHSEAWHAHSLGMPALIPRVEDICGDVSMCKTYPPEMLRQSNRVSRLYVFAMPVLVGLLYV